MDKTDREALTRILFGLLILLILAGLFFFLGKSVLGGFAATDDSAPVAKPAEQIAKADPVPLPVPIEPASASSDVMPDEAVLGMEPMTDSEPGPEIVALEETPPAVPEPVVSEMERVQCIYPGDGFTPWPQGVPFEVGVPQPEYTRPYVKTNQLDNPYLMNGNAVDEGYRNGCVVLMYNISKTGQPIDIEVYDQQPAESSVSEDMKAEAVRYLQAVRYEPATRNNKPIQINQNVEEVLFTAQ